MKLGSECRPAVSNPCRVGAYVSPSITSNPILHRLHQPGAAAANRPTLHSIINVSQVKYNQERRSDLCSKTPRMLSHWGKNKVDKSFMEEIRASGGGL